MNKKVDDSLLGSVMEKLGRKEISIATASVLLGVTERQVYKLKRAAGKPPQERKAGPRKSPPNKTSEETVRRVVELYRTKYRSFSYAHFHEKLSEVEGISINLKTVERILKGENLASPLATKRTKKRIKGILQSISQATTQDNEQNPCLDDTIIFDARSIHNRHRHVEDFGALIQLDARQDYYVAAEKWTLHLAIDVASGVFVGAFFDKEETLWGYQNVLHQIVTGYGIPKCILTDNRTVFEYLRKGSSQESKNTLIQFKYSCIQLGIRLNTTSVATYKSVIERANGTFGRRTPQELSLRGIADLGSANEFLAGFLKEMSGRFSHPYRGSGVFRPAPDEETLNNCIGSIARRSFDKAACVRFRNRYYYATVHGKIVAFAKGVKALIVRTFDARVIVVVESVAYAAVCIDDYEFSAEKEENPDNELFIEKHRVNSMELVNYRRKHVSPWNYNAFQKYVEREIDFIERNY